MDPFELNIAGAANLASSGVNKTTVGELGEDVGEPTDALDLDMSDDELLNLSREWDSKNDGYYPKIKPRQELNRLYYEGRQQQATNAGNKVVPSNIIFEAQETFIPQALSKNPEPVVWSDNTELGKAASGGIKTMLQFKADTMGLRKKLGLMLRQWSVYFVGVVKHGWDEKISDFRTELRKPQNFIWDPEGYIDEFGKYHGAFLGEKIPSTAEKMAAMFPKHSATILLKSQGKKGTKMTYKEYWTPEYMFCVFEDIVLDKSKNPFFNYDDGQDTGSVLRPLNHFAQPEIPYTFLSVFTLQEQPHDITNLIEQSIPNQDDINDQDSQVSRNLRGGNNSIALSGVSFNKETATQAARALEDGDPVLVPDGQVESAIKRIPASQLPPGLLQALQTKKDTLRSVFGTEGLSANPENDRETARGRILDQSHDSTRIGGGVGDALEQVADNIFNWWLQMMYVFYDEAHYAAMIGQGRAVETVSIMKGDLNRQFVVSVSPGSMKPKDEVSEMNLAIDLWNAKALDPITLFQKLDFPDPMEAAKKVTLWSVNPQMYIATYFPEQSIGQGMGTDVGPMTPVLGEPQGNTGTLSENAASASLSQVPLS